MFDSIVFNTETHMLELADAGLMGLYVMDCEALREIALILGKSAEAAELKKRADYYRKNLGQLWDEKTGIYRNKHTDYRKIFLPFVTYKFLSPFWQKRQPRNRPSEW